MRAKLLLAAPAAVLAVVATATNAQAHASVAYHGTDFVAVSANHRVTSVCDRERDGNNTMGYYQLTNNAYDAVHDPTTNGDCVEHTFPREIRRYQACEFNRLEGLLICEDWRNP